MSRGSNTGERSPEGPASPSPEPEYEALFGVESANDPEFEELMRRRALLLQELGECEDSDSEVLETPCKMQRLDDSYDAMEKIFEIEETNGAETSYFDDYKEETMTPRRSESQSSMEFEDEEEYEEFHEEVETNGKCPFSNGAKSPVIDTETLDEWLQQPLEENNGQSNGNLTVWKNVLDRMDNDCFYPMPSDWMRVTHNSGMPVYMHKFTRSVTLSRPYFLGEGSLRSHRIPLSAIPCLHRKRVDEQEAKKKEEREIAEATSTTDNPKLLQLQNIPTLTLQKQEDHSLSNDQVIEYCSSLFKFRKILVKKYKHVSEKFKARNQRKINAALARAGIKAPLEDVLSKGMDEEVARKRGLLMLAMPLAEGRFNKKMFLMNPVGKSSVMVLNEFAQRAMKARIEYVIDNTRNVSCPYRASATLIIRRAIRIEMSGSIREKLALLHEKQELSEAPTSSDDVKLFGVEPEEKFVLGYGQGASKKNARLAAAKDALKNLVPSVNINDDFMVEVNDKKDNGDTNGTNYEEQTMELFDTIKIDDNRVTDLCTKTGHPKPLALLKEAIAKSIKWNGLCLDRQNEQVGPQKTRVTLKLDKLEAQAEAVGGKAASQQAAQIMLQLMHPEFEHYGTLLRLYASVEEKSERKLARKQHDQVVRLQNKGSMLLPNMAVLGKLKEEMLKVGRGQTVRPPLAYSRPALEEGDSD